MRSRDLINGFDYGEYMQNQMFCFGSSDSGSGEGMSPGRSQAEFGTSEFAGMTSNEARGEIAAGRASEQAKAVSEAVAQQAGQTDEDIDQDLQQDIAMLGYLQGRPESDLGWVDKAFIESVIKGRPTRGWRSAPVGYRGVLSSFQDERSMPPGMLSAAFGLLGLPTKGFVTTGWGEDAMGVGSDMGGDGPETVPATYNPVTGEQQCPDGYVFDEDLQACRMDNELPFGTPAPSTGPYEAGDYARMGLLDVAPMGMSLFADRYGIPQTDFGAANLAFRRGSATRPQYFRQAPDLPGYTLLS